MKLKPVKLAPTLIAIFVIALVCIVRLPQWEFFDRLERMTYDLRVNAARRFPQPVATNLGAIFISDDSIAAMNNGSLGFRYGINWPRHVYGSMLRELSTQGARAVAFDILFGELHPLDDPVRIRGGVQQQALNFLNVVHPNQAVTTYTNEQGEAETLIDSDDYFAWRLKDAVMAILAAQDGIPPHPLFATNALTMGDISADRDADGVLRRARAFQEYRLWHPILVAAVEGSGADLSKTRVETNRILLFTTSGVPLRDGLGNQLSIKLNETGEFDAREYLTTALAPGVNPWRKPFATLRVWHMGIVLAAQALGLDLEHAQVDLDNGSITLHAANGIQRIIPADAQGFFYINWELTAADTRLTQGSLEQALMQDQMRSEAYGGGITNQWKDKFVVVGSTVTGNNLTDRGVTPLEKDTFLVSKHWNVANSIITGRFVHRASLGTELAAIALLGLLAAVLTWQLPPLRASVAVLLVAAGYIALAFWLYIQHRYWLPLVLPVLGALLMEHVCLVTWRVVFEQTERRRVKSVFSKIVSPEVVNELLGAETLSLGGRRCEATVLFADVRGFTELTDVTHERAEEYVREHKLGGESAEAYKDEVARETLNTVNTYLALVADMVKKYGGTLDKYIGDCVMAFWGAPTANSKHALACVRAAIDSQQALFEVNRRRTEENRQREIENRARVSAGLPPKPLLATLSLGTGINTGQVTVGLMGSEAHILNYTIFGREVNLASRLEHKSGHGRIVIGEATYEQLRRDDPALAAKCIPLEPENVKGFRIAVKTYEVPWQSA